ncbi:hypothetical protein AVEN_241341-1 [Araneus ventricosus]|uniref:Mariner Mos1 transposase n=1 Tax=Araneus ventricosus TaxID=182803 RepID=A0A4Y2SAR5_ARAVE|nr:hypothetical protein AVEN_241341-1 [Araneus ventricosus]
MITLNVENRGVNPAMHQYRRQSRIHGFKLLLCIWWDELSVVYYKLLKPNETSTEAPYRRQLMRLRRALKANDRYTSRDTTELFCCMTTLGHVLQNQSKPTWRHLNGKSCPNRRILQTLPLQIITCSDHWHKAWLSRTSVLMKISKNGYPQKTCCFSDVEFKCCQKDGKK